MSSDGSSPRSRASQAPLPVISVITESVLGGDMLGLPAEAADCCMLEVCIDLCMRSCAAGCLAVPVGNSRLGDAACLVKTS